MWTLMRDPGRAARQYSCMEMPSIVQVVPLEPLAVPVPEAARLLGVSPALVYELIGRGEVKAIRLGRRLVVPVASLQELIGTSGRPARATSGTES